MVLIRVEERAYQRATLGMHMNSLSLVDADLLSVLAAYPTQTLSAENLMAAREAGVAPPIVEDLGVTVERRSVPGPAGAPDVDVLIYRPPNAQDILPCIYHIHGGGFVLGKAEGWESVHHPLVANLRCVLITVEYRLAPEHPFPAGIEDCYAGLAWTFDNATALGIDRKRIGVMGESAGGGLAASLTLLARDRGDYPLAFQHLIYPMIDDRTCASDDPNPFAGEFIWTSESNYYGWSALLGTNPGSDGVSQYAAAARATDLCGLPPTFIGTGALDLFVDENIAYARRLIRAGVPTELHVYPGAFHGFDIFGSAPISQTANGDSLEALRQFLFRKSL